MTIIQLLHLILVITVIMSIFVPNMYLKRTVLIFLLYLMWQYMTGYEKCGLTEIEYMLLGETEHKQGFMYRLVKPIIRVPEDYFDKNLIYLHIIWIVILGVQLYNI